MEVRRCIGRKKEGEREFINRRKVSTLTLIPVVVSLVEHARKRERHDDSGTCSHVIRIRSTPKQSDLLCPTLIPRVITGHGFVRLLEKRYFDGVNTSITFSWTRPPTFSTCNTTFDLEFSFMVGRSSNLSSTVQTYKRIKRSGKVKGKKVVILLF